MSGLNQAEINQLIVKSNDEEKCMEILQKMELLIRENQMTPTDTQWIALVSHVSAMVNRSVNKEGIQDLNQTLFSEISIQSIEMGEIVCGWLSHLHPDEKYLLSIHFETIKHF